MAVDFQLIDELRAHGVQRCRLEPGDGVSARLIEIEFFDPRIMAEADAARLTAKHMSESADEILENIRKIEEDESLPELDRHKIAEAARARLIYGSS